MKLDKFEVAYLILFFLGLIFISQVPVYNDEFGYGDPSFNLVNNLNYRSSFWPEFLKDSSNPCIGLTFFQAPFVCIFGYNIFSLRIVSYLALFLSGIVFKKIIGHRSQINSSLLPFIFVLNPVLWHIGHNARPESLELLFVLLTIYYLSISKVRNDNKFIVLSAVFLVIAFHIYITAVYLLLAISLIHLYRLIKGELKFNQVLIFWGIVLLGVVIYLSINGYHRVINTFTGDYARVNNITNKPLIDRIKDASFFFYFQLLRSWILIPINSILILSFLFTIVTAKNIQLKITTDLFLLVVSVGFFILLGRTNPYYGVFIIVQMLIYYFKTFGMKPIFLVLMFLYSSIFILFYFLSFPIKEKTNLNLSELDKSGVILTPMHFRGKLGDFQRIIAVEDYKNIIKLKEYPFEDYVKKYEIKYILVDSNLKNSWYFRQMDEFLIKNNWQIVLNGSTNKINIRAFEEVPFYISKEAIKNSFKNEYNNAIEIYSARTTP